jgi:hypothetical protein
LLVKPKISIPECSRCGPKRRVMAMAVLVSLLAGLLQPLAGSQQSTSPAAAVVIGRLYGEDITVKGSVSFDPSYGMSTALLASGSEVTVRSGRAQIELMHGGAIAICGPAHFTFLESGGAITLALDYGKVRPQVEAQVTLTVYTPMVVATPIAIGTNPRDMTVGLDQQGAMCTLPTRGAARIEQQLTGQSLLVPQGGEISMNGGQLGTIQSAKGSCDCELLVTRNQEQKNLELSRPMANPATRPRPAALPVQPPREQPIYRVYLPPLTYDAKAPDPEPDPDPAHIFMIREAPPLADVKLDEPADPRLEAATDYVPPAPPVAAKVATPLPAAQPRRPNVFARFFNVVFRRRGTRCIGSGCGDSGN